MSEPQATFRAATMADVPAMLAVDTASWPPHLAISHDQAAARVRTYAAGQLVAERAGQIVAVAWAQRISTEFFERNRSRYDRLTDRGTFVASFDPEGDIYQLVGVGTLPAARGDRLGRKLVDRQIERARTLPGVRRIIGFTRPTGYRDHAAMPIDDYLSLRDERGQLLDRVVAFHLEAGARLVSAHADFRPADVDARAYGVLIEYPI